MSEWHVGVLIMAVGLYGTLVLAERRSGLVIMLLRSVLGSGVPVLHMTGTGLVSGGIAGLLARGLWRLRSGPR